MKKFYTKFLPILSALFMAVALVACDKDNSKDDPEPEPEPTPTPVETPVGPNVVYTNLFNEKIIATSIGNLSFMYNNKGQIVGIGDSQNNWLLVDYSEKTITYPDGLIVSYTTNPNGYAVGYTYSFNETKDGYKLYDGYTVTITYTAAKHISSLKQQYTATAEDEEGHSYLHKQEAQLDFSWQDGSLTKVNFNWQVKENTYPEGSWASPKGTKHMATSTIQNQVNNKLGQHTDVMMSHLFDDPSSFLYLCGLLGEAPEFLPALEIYAGKDYNEAGEETNSESRTYRYSYVFNNDGSIKTTSTSDSEESYTVSYVYELLGGGTPSQDGGNSDNPGGDGGNGGNDNPGGSGFDKKMMKGIHPNPRTLKFGRQSHFMGPIQIR